MIGKDYKYEIQLLAEEMAQEIYGLDFYDLSGEEQIKVYSDASLEYWDKRMGLE